jgi:Rrf2 family transcriptional regulator, iron-sulfur cluster assembly transcription factor
MTVLHVRSKFRLAVTAMIDLASGSTNGPVPLSKISERQKISMSCLEAIFSKLLGLQLVKSTRGPGGGYSLARNSESISLADIAFAVDESIEHDLFLIYGNVRSEIWSQINIHLLQQLASVNLRQLTMEQEVQSTNIIRS